MKGAANAPHHSSNVHYSQLESQMILTITISLIAYIAKTADAKAQSCDPKTCLSMSEAAALSREEFYFLKQPIMCGVLPDHGLLMIVVVQEASC